MRILENYTLAKPAGRGPVPRAPDILLLEKNVRILRPGNGRLAIVIPYQILSGPQTRYIREWLLCETHVESVIDLPAETFQPHTGTKASLLVLRRRKKPLRNISESEDASVFMATPKWIGHDRRGHTVYARNSDGDILTEVLSDMELVSDAFAAFRMKKDPSDTHAESFIVSTKDIVCDADLRLNARYYREGTLPVGGARRRGWKNERLAAVCKSIFFPTRFKRNYVSPSEHAVPFLGGANITELLIDTDKWIAKDDALARNLVVKEGWLLVTRSGTTGIVSTVPKAWDGMAISEHVIRIVPDPDRLSPAWLQIYLRSTAGQKALSRGVFGSVIDEITPEFIGDLLIPVPTDSKRLSSVIEKICRAETQRQRAIECYNSGLIEFEHLVGGIS